MTINGYKRFLSFAAGLFLFGLFLGPTAAEAQLQEVEQTVFGMDCAPCAHAMESRLGQMEGVASVSVSLNEGLATLTLEPTNSLTLAAIREAVTESGFSAEETILRLSGVLKESNGAPVLAIDAGEHYVLEPSEEGPSLHELEGGERVTIVGHVPAEPPAQETPWTMRVQSVRPAG